MGLQTFKEFDSEGALASQREREAACEQLKEADCSASE